MQSRKTEPGVAELQHLQWDDLRLFSAVAASGSMRRAAVDLGLNTSTVSRRLTQLEQSLATRLLERHPDGIKLTRAGEEVHAAAIAMVEQVNGLQRRVTGRDQRLAGVIRLTAAEIVGPLLCNVLTEFTQLHPAVSLELTITDAMLSVEREAVDIALRVAAAPPEQLIGRRAGLSAVGIYASKAYLDQHGYDLNSGRHAWIGWPRAVEHKPAFIWLQQAFPERRCVVRASSASTVLQAVQSDLGVAVLACSQVVNNPSLVLLQKLPTECSTPVWILTHPQARQAARIRALADHLYKALQRSRNLLEGTVPDTPR